MTLTPQQALSLQSTLISSLQTDGAIEMDTRFLRHIFGSRQATIQWARTWNINLEFFTRPLMNDQQGKPIEWVEFSIKPETKVLKFVSDDDL